MSRNCGPRICPSSISGADAYKDKMTSLALYKGIVIGVAGLLALFLTIVFVVKGAVIFPAAAALAWTVLAYVCIDFGFWSRIFGTQGQSDRVCVPALKPPFRRPCWFFCLPTSNSIAGMCGRRMWRWLA